MNPTITLVLAHDDAGAIGNGAGLPWPRIPEDMKHFRDATRGKPVIMGRRTMDTLGKPLPWRHNIVLTRDRRWNMPGVAVAHDVDGALKAAASAAEIMIIGGAETYRLFQPMARRILLTRVAGTHKADTFWTPDLEGWTERSRAEVVHDGQRLCAFVCYERDE